MEPNMRSHLTSPCILSCLILTSGCLIFDDPMPPRSAALHEISEDEQDIMCTRICEDIEPFSLTCQERGDDEGSTEKSIEVSPENTFQCDKRCVETASKLAGMNCDMTVGEYMDLVSRTDDCDASDRRGEAVLRCVFQGYE